MPDETLQVLLFSASGKQVDLLLLLLSFTGVSAACGEFQQALYMGNYGDSFGLRRAYLLLR